jgi:ATP-dependent RNA helicase HelY
LSAVGYLHGLDFEPDGFQLAAAEGVDRGESVVVAAPTGSGKTAIAEAAIHRSLENAKRAMYTTPIKALSNQKYAEFVAMYGSERVGLLTGDNSINGDAPVVVMTTEVLRNMMYANSPDLRDLGVVILDEVHYLADRARGGVWEEIIVHLDRAIPLVCLSATVSNASEFASWIEERRGPTTLVVEQERPVPLEVTYLVRDRFAGHELRLFPAFSGGRPNERLASMLRRDRGRTSRYVGPRRHETCDLLQRRGLLPAIYFIFSRKGCDAAARAVVDRGLRLTSSAEAEAINAYALESTAHLDDQDLDVLGFPGWLELLSRGVAAHHAGMVPAMKEAVEVLFSRGLVKLVFATETLALGINMPARTAVLENLSKFTGDTHEVLQPGEFTQLTGRAGRRGIDTSGTAVVLHSPYIEFERVAGIAGSGSHPLRSSFRPTYNMAVNLIARYDRGRAEELLAESFAEFSRTRQRTGLQTDLEGDLRRLAELRAAAEHPEVDIWAAVEGQGRSHAAVMAEFVSAIGPGDVLEWQERGKNRRVVVVAVGTGKQPRVLAVTESGDSHRFASGRFLASLRSIGRVDLPLPFKPRDASYRARVSTQLGSFTPAEAPTSAYSSEDDQPLDLSTNLDAARAAKRLEARIESHRRRVASVGPAVLGRFRSTTAVLEEFGYVSGWNLTRKGSQLRSLYNELDLVLADCLEAGLFSDLLPAQVAGLASAFTYEPRRADTPTTWPPELAGTGEMAQKIWQRISAAERRHGLEPTRAPDPGFAAVVSAWAAGATLSDLFDDEDPGIGDFVRNARQLLDLLRQVDETAAVGGGSVLKAIRAVDRGVVAAAGIV